MAASVSRLRSQSHRLWTCSRSKRPTPQRRAVSAICAGPLAAEVQTLSAENKPGGRSSFSSASPITAWEEPYMGEEIDHAAARLEKGSHNGAAFGPQHGIVADIEGDPAAESDRRDQLAGCRNGIREGLCRRISERRRREHGARPGQHSPACHAHDRPFLFVSRTMRPLRYAPD